MADHGTFYWNELATTDIEAAKAFYARLTGWTFDEMPMENGGTYHIAKAGETFAGGIMAIPEAAPAGTPPHWMSYIAVDDVDAALVTVKDGGGNVLAEPFDADGVGRIAVVQDPQGAAVALITPVAQD